MTPPPASDVAYMAVPMGRDRALPIGALAESLGWPRRMVEQAITDLRLAGKAVCSGSEGVWIGTADELEETYRTLRHRIVSQSVTAWAVRSTVRRMRAAAVQQMAIWEAA